MANRSNTLPSGHVLSWYGDDLTGSAAVMEVLATAGIPAVLFMDVPSAVEFEPYSAFPGIGVAGTARHHDPEWMEIHLPSVFQFLSGLNAPIAHYKVCSTFDSDPKIGSIGKAIDIALPSLGGEWTPLLVGAPPIGRYQCFGNLFASADGIVYRLDRHPTMKTHPITPMDEANIGQHLASQTDVPIGLVDLLSMSAGEASKALETQLAEGKHIISLDIDDDVTMLEAGRLIWQHRGDRLLAVGSQGVEYALVRYWRERGMIDSGVRREEFGPADRFAAVSASVSPITAAQLEWARENGFALIRIDVSAVVDDSTWALEINRVSEKALDHLSVGGSPIIFTALGPDDPGIGAFLAATSKSNSSIPDMREEVGVGLGEVLKRLIDDGGVTRAAVVGGDTSGQVTRTIGIRSLTFLSPMGHATSMMRAHGSIRGRPGLEYTLKGGQMGSIDFFGAVKNLHYKQ